MALSDVSWIMTTRNDGHGGTCPGVDNPTMARFRATCKSIQLNAPNDEIVVVEYAPFPTVPPVKSFVEDVPNLTVFTLRPEFHDLISSDSSADLPFYEFVAQDIGSKMAHGKYLIFVCPDNIFPSARLDTVYEGMRANQIMQAKKYDIKREFLQMDMDELIRKTDFPHLHRARGAAGDFTGVARHIYEEVGGYRLVHTNWYVDIDLVFRMMERGYEAKMVYIHYHIDHDRPRKEPGKYYQNRAVPFPEFIKSELQLYQLVNPDYVARYEEFMYLS